MVQAAPSPRASASRACPAGLSRVHAALAHASTKVGPSRKGRETRS